MNGSISLLNVGKLTLQRQEFASGSTLTLKATNSRGDTFQVILVGELSGGPRVEWETAGTAER